MSVLELPARISALPEGARRRVDRLFSVDIAHGVTDPPREMQDWLERQFGSVTAVERQSIVRVTNRWSRDGSLFSPLRGRRPVQNGQSQSWEDQVEATRGDAFCDPERQTPADAWGRVRGEHMISGANAAMYDAHHGVLVFREHDPLAFGPELVVEMLNLGRAWAERSRAEDPAAVNYLLIWNCGPRAGGSVVHGHAQTLLGRGSHYAQVERLRRDAVAYAHATASDYLGDLVASHRDLELLVSETDGVATIASITPVKERELLVIGPPGSDERDASFADAAARLVLGARDVLGMRAFNVALHRPPLAGEDGRGSPADGWERIGPILHLVDRGDPASTASDIGAMELYGAAVVGGDPYDVSQRLRAALAPG